MKIIQVPNDAIVTLQWIEMNPDNSLDSRIKTTTYTGLMRGDVVMIRYGHELNDEILDILLDKREGKSK